MYYITPMPALRRAQIKEEKMEIKCSKVLRDNKLVVLWQVIGGNQLALEAAGFAKEFMGSEYRMIKVSKTQAEALETQSALKALV